MSLLIARRQRDHEWTITITETDGLDYVYTASDAIRIKIGREGAEPDLDLTSTTPTANGSSVTASNPCTLILRAADLSSLQRGIYELEVAVVDDSDNDKIKHATSHILTVIETQNGDVSV